MLHFVLFRGVTCYTNSTASRIHVNTTKLYNITCTLVAIGVILQSLECISELHGIILGTRSGCSPKNYPMKGPADYLTTVSKEVGLETTVAPTGRKSCLLLLHHPVTHACLPACPGQCFDISWDALLSLREQFQCLGAGGTTVVNQSSFFRSNDQREPAVSYKWAGWSSRLQGNYPFF